MCLQSHLSPYAQALPARKDRGLWELAWSPGPTQFLLLLSSAFSFLNCFFDVHWPADRA